MGLEPGVGGWKVQTNPLSYGGTPQLFIVLCFLHSRQQFASGDDSE